MNANKVLKIVLREMSAIGDAWRQDWSEFDGRMLQEQLSSIEDFASMALKSKTDIDYTRGTDFLIGMCETHNNV